MYERKHTECEKVILPEKFKEGSYGYLVDGLLCYSKQEMVEIMNMAKRLYRVALTGTGERYDYCFAMRMGEHLYLASTVERAVKDAMCREENEENEEWEEY